MRNILLFFGAILLCIVITSCQFSREDAYDYLSVSGVSRELARFRKDNYREVHYALSFSIPESKEEPVTGKVDICCKLPQGIPLIVDFRADSSQVKQVLINGKEAIYSIRDEHIIVDTRSETGEEPVVSISFVTHDQSLNRRDDYLYTLLVPDRARTLFPCFDQPDLKALYTLTLDVPIDWHAVSNSAIAEVFLEDVSSRKQVRFRETEPLSTYLFSFVAGNMQQETFMRKGRSISVFHRETDPKKISQCPAIADEVFDALEWLEEYTAIPYPFSKYDLIILPGFQYGGMEHTGATLYNDRRMFLNEQPTLNEKLSRSSLIAHETAHMWFGDYVTMEWFDDVWTKEVFANYFAALMVEPLYPDINHRLNFIRSYYPPAYSEDRTAGSNAIRQDLDNLSNAGLVYGQIIYNKSPIVMEMLVNRIGNEAFRKGIREYLCTYAYGNTTWGGLIDILDKYTGEDLKAWSKAWINEKGMPVIDTRLSDNILTVSQSDPWKRGLFWPQDFSCLVVSGRESKEVTVRLGNKESSYGEELGFDLDENAFVVPNSGSEGYGFFRLSEEQVERCAGLLHTTSDEILKGSLLIILYENLLNQTIDPEWYMGEMLKYASKEQGSLLFAMTLGYIGNCHHWFKVNTESAESILWEIVKMNPDASHCLQAFRSYQSMAKSPEALQRLFRIWEKQVSPDRCLLSESDYINLSYKLALFLPDRMEEITSVQQSRITNPDRKREYAFIIPSLSVDKPVRDSVFLSLLQPENRRIEPWASTALSFLNHSTRQQEAIAYIRPSLDIIREVQRTGDIFFPTGWLRSLLNGHTSVKALEEVENFFADHPDFSPMLSNKIRQQADHLYKYSSLFLEETGF